MSRFDHECELCGQECNTVCVGALRLCQKCAVRKVAEYKPRSFIAERTYNDLDECAMECGNYYNLVSLLYCIGNLTGTDMNDIIETLDDIFDNRAI